MAAFLVIGLSGAYQLTNTALADTPPGVPVRVAQVNAQDIEVFIQSFWWPICTF